MNAPIQLVDRNPIEPLLTILLHAAHLVRDGLAVQLATQPDRHDRQLAIGVLTRIDALVPALERLAQPGCTQLRLPLDPRPRQEIKVPTWWSAPQAVAVYDFLTDVHAAVWIAHDQAILQELGDPPDPPHQHQPLDDDIPF